MEFFKIIILSLIVNNIVFTQFLGICPFLGVSNKISTSLGMGVAVIFVMTLSNIFTYFLQVYVLEPLHIQYMQTITFVLIIAFLVQVVEIILKKTSSALYQAIGIYLPLITTNCAILGITLLAFKSALPIDLLHSVVYAISTAAGFTLALLIMAGIREQLEYTDVPKGMKGLPISLITAGLISLAFMGFAGLVK